MEKKVDKMNMNRFSYEIVLPTGFKLAKKFREKFCLSPGIFGRSFYLNFRFAYIFYTFSLHTQLKIGRSLCIWGDYFSLVAL